MAAASIPVPVVYPLLVQKRDASRPKEGMSNV